MLNNSLKVAILSRNSSLYSTKRLIEAAEQRGHSVRVIDPLKCHIDLHENNAKLLYKKEQDFKFDAVIPRIGASITFFGTAVVRQFEMQGTYVLNSSLAISRSRDKLRTHQILLRKGIQMPRTGFAALDSNATELINSIGGAPLIIKLLEGTQGKGVILCETNKMAENIIHAFWDLKAFFLVQEFVKEANGSDLRCFVIGDKVVAAMKRIATNGDFRSNVHLGAKTQQVELDRHTAEMAVKAAKILGLQVAGVDIVYSNNGPLVLEVNSSPGLFGIETTTNSDIASMIIKHLEIQYNKHSNQSDQQA